jgi:glycosyltransferase involved in cell wall biosynthesis
MLGAAIITRNAEATISNALDSLQGIVQQIVVVDTGSTDATPQICSRFGAELHFFKWRDDFSAARNYALQFMRTDWILQIDSDEILDGDSLLKNIELFNNENIGGIQTEIHNLLKNKSVQKHTYTRLFKNHPQIRYSGRIHEQIVDSIRNAGFDIANSDITIHHFGYAETSPEKLQRNSDLLLKDLRDDPNDVFKKYHLALTHFAAQDFTSAENLLKEIYNSEFLSREQQETALLKLSQIALSREDFQNIHRFTDFTSGDPDREGLRLFIISTALLLQRNFDEALKILHSPLLKNSRLVDQQQVSAVISHFARHSSEKSF